MSRLDLDALLRKDRSKKSEKVQIETTFGEYLTTYLAEDPLIAQLSCGRLDEIIEDAGKEPITEDELSDNLQATERYKLFSEELFGIDDTIFGLATHIKSGKSRSSTGKMLVILLGPPSSGKSTIAGILSRALEQYNKRPVFRIKGCPINEEPLHLLPRWLRKYSAIKLEDCTKCQTAIAGNEPTPADHLHLGVHIEGDLCPTCRHMLLNKYADGETLAERKKNVNWQDVPVETFKFSAQDVCGISSFAPSDKKNSDITALTIRENSNVTNTKGYDQPNSFDIGGLIGRAQRGMFESEETCSNDEEILNIFLGLCQEKRMIVPGATHFPRLWIDVFTLGHTNMNVFMEFSASKKLEGLHNRIYVIECPYTLKISNEIKLYNKLIVTDSDFVELQKKHIAPGSLELAALFAILSRLHPSNMGVSLMTKAKLYNGDMALFEIKDKNKTFDLRSLKQEFQTSPDRSKHEGMFGLTPRDVLAALNTALVQNVDGCLTPSSTIKALRDVFKHRTGIAPEMVEKCLSFLNPDSEDSVITEYKESVILKQVNRAFLRAYNDLSRSLFDSYIENIKLEAARNMRYFNVKIEAKEDALSGKPKEVDEKLIRSVEGYAKVSESEAKSFRADTLMAKGLMGERFSYDTYTPLAKAVEDKLLDENKALWKIVIKKDAAKDDVQKKRADDLFGELLGNGFCEVCAHEVIEKADEYS